MTNRTRLALVLLGLVAPAFAQESVPHQDVVRTRLEALAARPDPSREGPELRSIADLGADGVPALGTVALDPAAPEHVRAWAAFALRLSGSATAAPILVSALADPSWRVRKNAACGLGVLGVREGAIVPLLDRLADPDESVAQSARGALDRLLTAEDVPLLPARLVPWRPALSRQALVLLAGQLDADGLPVLLAALADPDPRTRARAVFFLSRSLDRDSTIRIEGLLADPAAEVRFEAVRALAAAGPGSSPEAIEALLSDPSAEVRVEACRALARRRFVAAARALEARAADPAESPAVAVAAAEAAFDLSGRDGAATARSLLASGTLGPGLRARVHRLLGRSNDALAIESLLAGLDDGSRIVRKVAAASLAARIGQPSPFDPEGDPATRREQVATLREWWANRPPGELPPGAAPPVGRRFVVESDVPDPFSELAGLTLEEMAEIFETFYGWEEPAYLAPPEDPEERGPRRLEFPDGRRASIFPDGRRRLEYPWGEAVETTPSPVAPTTTTARVFRLRRDYRDHVARFESKWPFLLDAGGYYSHGRAEIVTFDKPPVTQVLGTLVHEASHQVMRLYVEEAPVWLGEGLAEYFEHSLAGPDGGLALGGLDERHVAYLTKLLDEGRFTPLDVLDDLDYFQFHADGFGPLEIGHYGESWSLVHFLQHGEEGRYAELLPRYVMLLREGADAGHAWDHLLDRAGLGRGALEEKWKAHVRRLSEVAVSDD